MIGSWPGSRCCAPRSTVERCTSPARSTSATRDGSALDLHRGFGVDDDPDEIGHFLAEAGFLHLQGVFSEAEMAQVSAELDDALAAATQDDGASWWARTADGWYPAAHPRLQPEVADAPRACSRATGSDASARSPTTRWSQRSPREGDSAEGLLKKIGVVEGISDVSWHKDCTMGGHSRGCCGLTVGIAVTGADRNSGELGVVAGSHRANVQSVDMRADLDLPRLPAPDADRRPHRALQLHAAHEPSAGRPRAARRLHRVRPRAATR